MPRHSSTSSARYAIFLIFLILFALYGNFKFPITIALGVILTEPVGALIALKLTHTPLSVSSALGLARASRRLRRNRGDSGQLHQQAAPGRQKCSRSNARSFTASPSPDHDDCSRRLPRTSPAAISTGVGSDTQKPFAIVVVAGLLSRLLLGFFVNPVLYELVARDGDVLQV